MKHQYSKYSLYFCYFLFFITGLFYYPRWKNGGTEQTLTWDVSGYYLYLPSVFIYQDLKELKYMDSLMKTYSLGPDLSQQAFKHQNGNYVMKYSCGQAIVFLPFFTLAHLTAKIGGYPADGFSLPYQFFISIGTLFLAGIGLWYLRKVLLEYFSDIAVSIALVLIAIGTNYFNYGAIDTAMTHSTLFTIYCVLIYLTIQFYKQPTVLKAVGLGALIGFAALIRPTEIISCVIPILWNFDFPLLKGIKTKFNFFKSHSVKLVLAAITCGLIGSIQLIYWKYVSGEWLVYSYQEQSFSWLHPHLYNGFFSYKAGWLVYTPLMAFSLIGFISLYRSCKRVLIACLVFAAIFIYITFAWDIWWYGGSLGQRAMVQGYPILAFSLVAFIQDLFRRRWLLYSLVPVWILCIYLNLWWTHQAHKGDLFYTTEMTEAYFWKVLGRIEVNESVLKLLDTEDFFEGTMKDAKVLYHNNFEKDTVLKANDMPAIEGSKSLMLNSEVQFSPFYFTELKSNQKEWVRVEATYRCKWKEWNTWLMTQTQVHLFNNDKCIKTNFIRIDRFLSNGDTKTLYLDMKLPKEEFNKLGVIFWNGNGWNPMLIDELKIISFNEE